METIARITAFLTSGAWLTTHTPAQSIEAFMGLVDSAQHIGNAVQMNSATIEHVSYIVFSRLVPYFI